MIQAKQLNESVELHLILKNDITSSEDTNDMIVMFKDKTYSKDLCVHLKIFEIDKLKVNTIHVNLMLIELDSKYTSLLKQNE